MPPTKTKLRRDFDAALSGYLESIRVKKEALFAVTNQPSKGAEKKYENAALKEKEARRVYRKATKKFRNLIRQP